MWSVSMRTPPTASRSSPDRASSGSAGCIPTTSLLEPSISRITKSPWLLTSSLAAPGAQEHHQPISRRAAARRRHNLPTRSHRVPLSIAELGAAGHADVHARSVDLHQRDAVLQGQNKPVPSFFCVPVENHTFGVKGAQLKGRLDAAGNQEAIVKAGGQ